MTKLTNNAKQRLKTIYDNLHDITFNNEVYKNALYVEEYGEKTDNNKMSSLASQLSCQTVKEWFEYKKKTDDNKKPFIYFRNDKQLDDLKQLIETQQTQEKD